MKTIGFFPLTTSLTFMLLVLSLNIYPQVTQEWVGRYGGPGNGPDKGLSIVADNSGNVYVTGYSADVILGFDYITIKYNMNGIQQWIARYNGPGNGEDNARSIAKDNFGNVYVTGWSLGSGTYDYATVKYDSSGVQQWVARYDGPANSSDRALSVAVDGSGNVYVTGYSTGIGTIGDYATIKYNSSGVQQWVARYNGPANAGDEGRAVTVDNSGNVYVTGVSWGTSDDYATIKYDSNGIQQWVARYNGPGNGDDNAYSIACDNSANVYVAGWSEGNGSGKDYATIKYNSNGTQQWVARYNGPGNYDDLVNWYRSIALDNSSNVYVTGMSWGIGTVFDYATIKYDSIGTQQWVARYNGPGNNWDRAYSIALDNSSNVYITGYSRSDTVFGTEDYATIKYNSSGIQQWVARYDGTGNREDIAYSIAADNSGNVYVTGESWGNGTSNDCVTIKYSQSIGIQPISNEIPKEYNLSQNYPNPFNSSTIIKFALPKSSLAKLILYDVLGREIAMLVNEELKAGIYVINWHAFLYPSGFYFYKLLSYDYAETKKMVIIK